MLYISCPLCSRSISDQTTTCPGCGHVQEHHRQQSEVLCIPVVPSSDQETEAMRIREEAERRAREIAQAYKETSRVSNLKGESYLKIVSLVFALGVGFLYWVTLGSLIWSLCRGNASTTLYGLVSNYIVLPFIVFSVYRCLHFFLKLFLLRRL